MVAGDAALVSGSLSGPPGQPVRDAAVDDAPDARRWLQLALAALWLLDGILQFQRFMFSKGFSQMLAATAAGNPAAIAVPIHWSARLVAAHPAGTDAAFAVIQVLIGLGIASRRTTRAALGASIAWAVAVWWLGEGLGGVLSGDASPLTGAPGAVILYALLAVLLWPASGRARPAPFVAASMVGTTVARVLWVILWGSLAYLAVAAGNRTAQGPRDSIAGLASGEPGWLAAVNRGTASMLDGRGLAASIVVAALLTVVAAGVVLPARVARATTILAIVVSLAIWVAGQDLGAILTGNGTDPNSGVLLALIALSYWPARGTPC